MKGAHGLQPADHEHVRCRFCNREDAHVEGPGPIVLYAPHSRYGSTVQCVKSVSRRVEDADRHRPDPEKSS